MEGAHSRRPAKGMVYASLFAAVMSAGLSAHAATLTWDPTATPTTPAGGSGTWDLTTPIWSNGTSDQAWTDVSAAGGDTAIFKGIPGVVTLNTNLSALGLQFLVPGYTISGTGILTLGTGGIDGSAISSGSTTIGNNISDAGVQTWNVHTNSNLTVSGIISGAANITKAGGGNLILSNANTFTGSYLLTAGTLTIANTAAVSTATNTTISTGTVVDIATDGGNANFTLAMGTGTVATIASDVHTGTTGINQVVNTVNFGGGTITFAKGANVASGTPSITVNNFGLTSGTAGAITYVNPTTAVGTLGNISITGTANAKVIDLDGVGANNTVTGLISNGLASANLSLSKSGASTWTLLGNNTYSGITTVYGGTLQFTSNGTNTAATGAYAISGGKYLFQGNASANTAQSIGGLSGAGNGAFTIALGGTNLTTITSASLSHALGNSAFLVDGTNLGEDSTGTSNEARMLFTAAPPLTGAGLPAATGINAASQNTGIVPFLLGEAASTSGGLGTTTGTPNTFLTYVAGSGLRPLNPADEFTNNAIVAGNNTYITTATTVSTNTPINSLVIGGGDLSVADGATLTDTSGALLFTASNSIKPAGTTGAMLFPTEGIVTVNSGVTGTIATPLSGSGSLTKGGPGTLVLSGNNTFTGTTTLSLGTLNLTGSLIASNTTGIGNINPTAGNTATMNISGTLVFGGGNFSVGNNTGGTAIMNILPGANITTGGSNSTQRNIQTGINGMGVVNMSGGNLTIGGFFIAGITTSGASGIWNISGGNLTVNPTASFIFGGTVGATAGTTGVVNLSGGNFTSVSASSAGGIFVGEGGTGIINVSGGVMSLGGVASAAGLTVGGNASTATGGSGLVNLGAIGSGGGIISTNIVRKGAGNGTATSTRGIFNFHGGTLQAATGIANAAFFTGLTNAYVYAEGGTIDNNSQSITVGQALLAPSGLGVTSIGTGGLITSGYTTAPLVTISGGTGLGASAVANINGSGVLTGFTITNPGSGYLSTDAMTVTLSGGGYASNSASSNAVGLASNVSGGLTFIGTGATTLTGVNTYTGTTKVGGGTVILGGAGSLTGPININGTGARLTQTSATPITSVVTVTNGTLDGTGIVNTAIVPDGTGGIISNGVAGVGSLTLGNLTFNGAGTLNLMVSSQSAVLATTNLTTGATNAAGKVTVNVTNSAPWTAGTYQLASYTTLGGVGFSDFTKGTIAGLGARQSATLTNASGFIDLTIAGDNPRWSGAGDATWSTATQSPKNWALITSGSPTDYIQGDSVLFDDNATGSTSVNISNASVSPTTVTFNNNSKPYTISSTGGFGIATGSVTLNGSGVVTLATANTYSGPTILNAGTLNINNASAIGTGAFTINGGSIDNTSTGPVTLSTVNAQAWNADFTFNGTANLSLGTGAVVLGGTRTVTTNGSATLTVAGPISGAFGLTKSGPGTLALSGVNTYSNTTIIHSGTLAITGGVTGTLTTSGNSDIQISPLAGDNGTLLVSGGVVNANRVIIGGNSGNTPPEGDTATVIQTGGVINSQEWFTVGSGDTVGTVSFPIGEYDLSGTGVLNVLSQQMEIANFAGTTGTVNMSGNTTIRMENNTSIAMGANALAGDGTFNQNGGNVTFYSDAGTTVGGTGVLFLGRAGTLSGTYTYNLNGGTLTVPQIAEGTPTATSGGQGVFNFNGGTLKAAKATTTFITGITQVNVQSGGAIIDDGGFAVTIPQLISSGNGADGGLTKLGNGTLTLSANNTYTGPTTVNAGSLVLTGANTYTGATNVNAGKLIVSGAGSINSSSGVAINAGGNLVALSSVAVAPTITVNNSGLLNGSNATVNSVIVASGTGTIANGNSDTGVLNVGSLTFSGAGIANVTLAGPSATTSPGIVVGTLTTSASGHVTINAINSVWNNGTYDLISYSSLGGAGFSAFTLGNVTGLTPRQSDALTNIAGEIAITITGGASPIWTGALNNDWTTAVLALPKNFKLSNGSPTDFLTNDTVIFDDTATGSTTVSIGDANVAPTTVTFNNSAKAYTINGPFGITGTGAVIVSGGGSVTLNANSSYSGGTTLTAGTLNINSAAAIGTGNLTINGGTVNNTSGSAVVTTAANLALNGDFSFTGGSNLSLGAGPVTLSGTGIARSIAVAAGDLAIGPIQSAAAFGLTKTGLGVLSIVAAANDNAATHVSTIGGDLNVVAGTVQIGGNDFHAGGLVGAGTVEDGSATTRWLFVSNTANETFSGILQDGAAGGRLGLNKSGGNSTLTLTGNNTYSDATNVGTGTLIFSGNTNNVSAIDNIGNVGGTNGVLVVGPGATFGANDNPGQFTSALVIGGNATSAGDVRLSSATSSLSVGAQLGIGAGIAGSYAGFTMSNGTVNVASFLVVGFGGDHSVLNVGGGNLTVATNLITVGAGNTTSIGLVNLTGGNISSVATAGNAGTIGGIFVGEVGSGTFNVSGGTATLAGKGLVLGNNTNSSGQVNLNGGNVITNVVAQGTGVGLLNFNGGKVTATGSSTTFMQGIANTYIYSGGATIDDGGNAITVGQILQAPTGGGVTGTGVTATGTGFIDTPLVQVSGDGTGATAVANVDASGNLTGITITNPGINYTNASFTLLGGGVGSTNTISGSPAIVANVGGGLTKNGAGSVILTAANTYTGPTIVNAGSLFVNNTTGSGTGTANVTLNGGLLGGSGVITGSITPGTAAHAINPGATGANSVGTLTVGGLRTNSNTTLSFDLGTRTTGLAGDGTLPNGTSDLLAVAGNITLNGGSLAITSQATTGIASLGYYKVVSYSGTLTGSTANITLPAVANNIEYTLDASRDPGYIDVHRGYLGDANDDGTVNVTDLQTVLNHLGVATTSWNNGNFDGAATIDLNDLNAVLNHLGTSIPAGSAIVADAEALVAGGASPAATPEPASLGVLAIGAAALLTRRRKA